MMPRLFQCGVLLRAYTMAASFLYSSVSLTQDDTKLFQVAHASEFATWSMWALGVLAVLGTIDLVVNDLMPERFIIRPALRDRHLVTMGISLCFTVQAWTCVTYGMSLSPLPFYLQYIVLVPASAFADVNQRFKQKPKA